MAANDNLSISSLIDANNFLDRATKSSEWPTIQQEINDSTNENRIYGAVADKSLKSDFRASFFHLPFPTIPDTGIGYASDTPDITYTVRAGLFNLRTINDVWCRHRNNTDDVYNVLDFGCGSGRLLRFSCEFGKNINVSGCDVNPKAVEWLSDNFPCRIDLIKNKFDLSFLPEPVDLIYAWSIFTHFSEEEHLQWLDAMMGQLKPGGLLIATIKSTDMLDRIANDPEYRLKSNIGDIDLNTLYKQAENGFVFFNCYDTEASSDHGIDAATFGQTYISHEYIRNHWCDFGEVVDIDVAVPDWQDLVVMRRT